MQHNVDERRDWEVSAYKGRKREAAVMGAAGQQAARRPRLAYGPTAGKRAAAEDVYEQYKAYVAPRYDTGDETFKVCRVCGMLVRTKTTMMESRDRKPDVETVELGVHECVESAKQIRGFVRMLTNGYDEEIREMCERGRDQPSQADDAVLGDVLVDTARSALLALGMLSSVSGGGGQKEGDGAAVMRQIRTIADTFVVITRRTRAEQLRGIVPTMIYIASKTLARVVCAPCGLELTSPDTLAKIVRIRSDVIPMLNAEFNRVSVMDVFRSEPARLFSPPIRGADPAYLGSETETRQLQQTATRSGDPVRAAQNASSFMSRFRGSEPPKDPSLYAASVCVAFSSSS